VAELIDETERLLHGTTVATNAIVERKGAKVGLITTRGHRDVMLMMRGTGRTVGLPVEAMLNLVESESRHPWCRARSSARSTSAWTMRATSSWRSMRDRRAPAVQSLLDEGVEAICVSFLWSFENPAHEDAVADLVREMAPDVFVTAAHRLIPKWGEYERTVGAVINCYVGPVTKRYLEATSARLHGEGYTRPFLIMQSTGGLAPVEECGRAPLLTVGSGPVGGLEGARFLAGELGIPNVIAADMGGTTFDVGLVVDGKPLKAPMSTIGQYQYSLPVVDVQSIGSGGGSIAWVDEVSGVLRSGPRAQARSQGRRATAAAAPRRRSRTPTSSSASSIRRTCSAAT
jgi:N-methylhydantoinase A